jgi:hypothetical protein
MTGGTCQTGQVVIFFYSTAETPGAKPNFVVNYLIISYNEEEYFSPCVNLQFFYDKSSDNYI